MIQLVYEPSVYVVGRQQVVREELNRYLADEGVPDWKTDTVIPAEELAEVAGRSCYMSYKSPRPGGNKAYLDNILESGHGSVAEHGVWSIIATGLSRSLTHEWVRHRLFSYSQLSQRYVDEADCRFVVPPALTQEVKLAHAYREWSRQFTLGAPLQAFYDSPTNAALVSPYSFEDLFHLVRPGTIWLTDVKAAQDDYIALTEYLLRKAPENLAKTDKRKWARQAARSVLPNCTETKIFVTGNARSWRHFIEMRGSPHADAEIRCLAVQVYLRLREESPHLFGDYELIQCPDGSQGAIGHHPKV